MLIHGQIACIVMRNRVPANRRIPVRRRLHGEVHRSIASQHVIARPIAEVIHDEPFHVQLITKVLNIG